MKSLKLLLSALAFVVALAAPLSAQQKKGGMSPDEYVARVNEAVGGSLSQGQKDKIMAIASKTQESMKGMSKEDRKEKGGEMQKKQREDVMAVLNAEQKEKFKSNMPSGKKK